MTINQLRRAAGMTQAGMAEFIGCPKRTVENWDEGSRSPQKYVIELIEYKLRKENKIMKTTLYMVRTTFLGADGPSELYFDERTKAEDYLAEQLNGEIVTVEITSSGPLNYNGDGCTWNDLTWGFEIPAVRDIDK